jgi:hypothetical protein
MLFSPVLLPTSPTAGDVFKEFKKTWQFVSDLQIYCHVTTHNSETALKTNDETSFCFVPTVVYYESS